MKVSELIELLKKLPQDAKVVTTASDHCGCPSHDITEVMKVDAKTVFIDSKMFR